MQQNGVRTVLLVEDEPLVLQSTAELLNDDGYEVIAASSYEDAVASIEARPETVALVTDIGIEGERDGIALAQLVAQRWPHIRTVIVSGQERPTGDRYPENAIFFTKPYAPGALLTIVRQCLDGELEPRAQMDGVAVL